MKPKSGTSDDDAAANITRRIQELGDWRGETLALVRQLIHEADPDIQEEWKWRGTPVWSHDGIVCTGESYKQVVKLTFARGASIKDPKKALKAYPGLFRRSLEEDNRMCLCSFMAAEYDDLPDTVKTEVQAFADVNIAWLTKMLAATSVSGSKCETKARAIFAAVAGAQLMARSRADISLFDALIASFRQSGLIPT